MLPSALPSVNAGTAIGESMTPDQIREIGSSCEQIIPYRARERAQGAVTPDWLIETARRLAEAEIAMWLTEQADVNLSPHTARRVLELAEQIQLGKHRRG